MKRSEMIQKIHDRLIGTSMHQPDWENYLLTIFEELGMLPPLNLPEGVLEESTGYCGWESEDE
jgi:hypothetical protein